MAPRTRRSLVIAGLVAVIGTGLFLGLRNQARAQGMVRPKGPGVIHFETKLGSFKLLSSDNEPLDGKLVMSFKGGLLISGIDHDPKPQGKVRLEYTYAPLKKYAYSGEGSIVVDGTYRSVQWFGSNLTATFTGRGKLRLSGEFDSNLNTGTYWYSDPKKKVNWPANNLAEVLVPGYVASGAPTEGTETVPQMRKPGGQ